MFLKDKRLQGYTLVFKTNNYLVKLVMNYVFSIHYVTVTHNTVYRIIFYLNKRKSTMKRKVTDIQ